ncbi:translationally-controlled tumor protein-like [Zalophus californianus]|uniref:Translationally-controlled tumor protein n=1 Tax=Zalophus californianus TaxID=9704 RepID=A0A6P9EYQ2_ZALCA|nr:translationally-controlled tumor protein-like [Zalophus californianus]
MIIYRDLISHDEMFSDIYKIREMADGLCLEVEGKETSFTKEAYKKYIKDYMKSIKGKLEEQRPERVKPSMTGAAEQIKHILANFKNYQFFIGENMNPDGMVALLDYREDGVTPYMIFFNDGLEMERC